MKESEKNILNEIFFHPDAEKEFMEAINYYDGSETGLGYDFALEVYASITLIITHPHAWQTIEENIRRSLVKILKFALPLQDVM